MTREYDRGMKGFHLVEELIRCGLSKEDANRLAQLYVISDRAKLSPAEQEEKDSLITKLKPENPPTDTGTES